MMDIVSGSQYFWALGIIRIMLLINIISNISK